MGGQAKYSGEKTLNLVQNGRKEGACQVQMGWQNTPGRPNGTRKGPEGRVSLACLRKILKASVAGAE